MKEMGTKAKRAPSRTRPLLKAFVLSAVIAVGALIIGPSIYKSWINATCEKIAFGALGIVTNGTHIGLEADIYTVCVATGEVTQLTFTSEEEHSPAWSPNGQHIAFLSARDSALMVDPPLKLYIMDANGQHQRRLTAHEGSDFSPIWSPDGQKIIFKSRREGQLGLYMINANGTNEQFLTTTSWDNPFFAPDGQFIVFKPEKESGLFTFNLKDGTRQQITAAPSASFPQWLPDGETILYSDGSIHIIGKDGQKQTLATGEYPVLSPNGEFIAFNANGVSILDTTGHLQSNFAAAPFRSLIWSSDSTKLAYIEHVPYGSEKIFVIDKDGTNKLDYLASFPEIETLSWQPR